MLNVKLKFKIWDVSCWLLIDCGLVNNLSAFSRIYRVKPRPQILLPFLVMVVPFTELKSGSGLAGFQGKLIVVYAIFETNNDVLIKDIILISIKEIESYKNNSNKYLLISDISNSGWEYCFPSHTHFSYCNSALLDLGIFPLW